MWRTTLADVWDFATNQEAVEDLQFILTTRDHNLALAQDGFEHHYGMGVGQAMASAKGLGHTDNLTSRIIARTAAAADARMGVVNSWQRLIPDLGTRELPQRCRCALRQRSGVCLRNN